MKKLSTIALSFLAFGLMTAPIHAAEVAQDVSDTEYLTTLSAKVVNIDHAKKTIELQGADGDIVVAKVSDQVKNFKEIKKGDEVSSKFYQSIAWEIKPPVKGEQPSATATKVSETAPKKSLPWMAEAGQLKITAIVEEVSPKTSTFVLKGPQGNLVRLKASDPKALEAIKKGDQIDVTYSEALAVAVEKVQKASL